MWTSNLLADNWAGVICVGAGQKLGCKFHLLLQDTVFKLSSHGMRCGELSGDMNKEQRQNTMRRFQQGDYRALIVRHAHPLSMRPQLLPVL